jgi:hypothetical protein
VGSSATRVMLWLTGCWSRSLHRVDC